MTHRRLPRVGDVVVILTPPRFTDGETVPNHGVELGALGEVIRIDSDALPYEVNHSERWRSSWWYTADQLEVIGDVR